MHNRNSKWRALWWDRQCWWAGGAQGRSRSRSRDLWCLAALRIMGSTKQHHGVQPGPGSLQSSSLLQPTTAIKSQLHTSVKAKHCSPSAALPPVQGGTAAVSGTAPRHPKTAGVRSLLPAFSVSQLCSQSMNKSHFSPCRGFPVPMAWHTGWHRESCTPSCPTTAAPPLHRTLRIPICSRRKGRQRCCPFLHLLLSPLSTDIWCPLSHSLFYVKCCYQFVFDSSNGKFPFADQLWRGTTVQFPRQQIWQIATVSTQNSRESTEELQRVREKVLYTQ